MPDSTPTPVPLVVRAPVTINSAKAVIPAAQLAANLNAVPSTPQSILQLLGTYSPLPVGVSLSAIRSIDIRISGAGDAKVTIRYAS